MVKAMRDASLSAIGCVAHTLQLVVHDGVLSQRAVTGLLAACHKIVGHLKHSSLAYCRLKEIQQNLGLPQHRLKQDEPTWWNSSLYMIQSVIEQKVALAAYATKHYSVVILPTGSCQQGCSCSVSCGEDHKVLIIRYCISVASTAIHPHVDQVLGEAP